MVAGFYFNFNISEIFVVVSKANFEHLKRKKVVPGSMLNLWWTNCHWLELSLGVETVDMTSVDDNNSKVLKGYCLNVVSYKVSVFKWKISKNEGCFCTCFKSFTGFEVSCPPIAYRVSYFSATDSIVIHITQVK